MAKTRLLLCLAGAAAMVAAQPEFDAASVKPAAPVTGHFQYHMTMKLDGTTVDIANASLSDLMRTAYRVNTYQISGPDWMAGEKFDVVAKIPAGGAKEQVPEMLQGMLAARFRLAVHHALQERQVRALAVGKNGAKLKESQGSADAASWSRSMATDGSMHVETRNMSMPALAQVLATFINALVVDATEMKGQYDVPLDFAPEDLQSGANAVGAQLPAEASTEASGSSIAASLQRLGLKLEPRKMRVDIIVVDHVEKTPTGN